MAGMRRLPWSFYQGSASPEGSIGSCSAFRYWGTSLAISFSFLARVELMLSGAQTLTCGIVSGILLLYVYFWYGFGYVLRGGSPV